MASSVFSNERIAIVISKWIFPSVWLLILSVALLLYLHEIMSTLFFGAGGRELGDSCSISLPFLFVGLFCLLGLWPFGWISDSLALLLLLRLLRWFSYFHFDCEVRLDILRLSDPCDHGKRSIW